MPVKRTPMPRRSLQETKTRLKARGRTRFPVEWVFGSAPGGLSAGERQLLTHLRDTVRPLANPKALEAHRLRRAGKKIREIALLLNVKERTVRYWLDRKPLPIRKRELVDHGGFAYMLREESKPLPVVVLRATGACGADAFPLALSAFDLVGTSGRGYCRRCKEWHDFVVTAQVPAPYAIASEWQARRRQSRVAVGIQNRLAELFPGKSSER